MVGKRGTLEERFWPKVLKGAEKECWLWQANKNNMGYGMIQSLEYGRKILAHRASFIIKNGPIKDDICVLHRCDTPSCVNPNHLFLGTKLENNKDRDAKGRTRYGHNPLYPPPIFRGEDANSSKLTNTKVLEMRDLMSRGATTREMVVRYGIERSTVKRIRNRRTWKHI